jgi:hypothetical protein
VEGLPTREGFLTAYIGVSMRHDVEPMLIMYMLSVDPEIATWVVFNYSWLVRSFDGNNVFGLKK